MTNWCSRWCLVPPNMRGSRSCTRDQGYTFVGKLASHFFTALLTRCAVPCCKQCFLVLETTTCHVEHNYMTLSCYLKVGWCVYREYSKNAPGRSKHSFKPDYLANYPEVPLGGTESLCRWKDVTCSYLLFDRRAFSQGTWGFAVDKLEFENVRSPLLIMI